MFRFMRVNLRRMRLSVPSSSGILLLGIIVSHGLSLGEMAGADPLERLKTFTAFESIDVGKLQAGEILGEPGSPMKFANGISAETCFAVRVPAAEAARQLQVWDPSLRGTVKTLEFHPVKSPCTAADFQNLSLNPEYRPHRWLLDKTLDPLDRNSPLNLTREEARQLADCVKNQPGPQTSSACWAKILLARTRLFQGKGFAGIAPYEGAKQAVLPGDHIRTMLRERPSVASEFAPLLERCGLIGDKGTMSLEPFHYWALYEANRHATLALGAVFLLPIEDQRYQLLDVEYYVSANYYTWVTLYEVWPWPVQPGAKPGALVWRGDFFAAPNLAYTRGVERLAYGGFMLQELKKTIRSFQEHGLSARPGPKPSP